MKDLLLGQESAFPEPYLNDPHFALSIEKGMSKRFYAACAAMQGLLPLIALEKKIRFHGEELNVENLISASFVYADELLKQEQQ